MFSGIRYLRVPWSNAAITVAFNAHPDTRHVDVGFSFCSPREKCFSKSVGKFGQAIVQYACEPVVLADGTIRKIKRYNKNPDGTYSPIALSITHIPGALDRLSASPIYVKWPPNVNLERLFLSTLMRLWTGEIDSSKYNIPEKSWLADFLAVMLVHSQHKAKRLARAQRRVKRLVAQDMEADQDV